ncbi:MAG: hypothetical protein ABIN01_24305 [Ferruginibacter sp.]
MKHYKLLFSLLIIVTICNCYIFFNRDDYEYIRQSSYFDLYQKFTNPSIQNFAPVNDSKFVIKLTKPSPTPVTWFVRRDSNETIVSKQVEPTIIMKQGLSTYTIFSNSLPDTLIIKAEYYPKDYYNKLGNKQSGGIVIYTSDFPFSTSPQNTEEWGDNKVAIGKIDEEALAIILKDSMHIKPNNNTVEKIKKIGNFLYNKIFKSRGIPTDSMMALPVFQQYKAAAIGQPIWCSNYAQIFNMFATAANIKTRYLEIKLPFGPIAGGVHVFNEYYIPEQKKWAAGDIMFNNLAYWNAAGKLLNAVEVKNTDPANVSVSVLQSSIKDSFIVKPFTLLESEFFDLYGPTKNLYYYHDINLDNIYPFKEKARRYLTKAAWFEIYSDNTIIDNRSFYIKQLFIVIELIVLLLLFVELLLKLFYKKRA